MDVSTLLRMKELRDLGLMVWCMAENNPWRELSFNGRSAVVTGAARGIGRAVAYRLAGLGARTVIWDRDGDVLEQTGGELRELLRLAGTTASAGVGTGRRVRVEDC